MNNIIEIIFEECGWKFDKKDKTWNLSSVKVYKDKLHQVINQGDGIKLKLEIIKALKASKKRKLAAKTPNVAFEIEDMEATIERLVTKRKNRKDTKKEK